MHNVYLVRLHLFATWAGLLAGVSSGAVMGLLFTAKIGSAVMGRSRDV
jgi:hypothetical protein